jgi:Ca2+-transporting ATPase
VIFSLLAHVLVIYVPFLQEAFHTKPLAMMDWAIAAGVGATLLVVMELVKVALRRSRGAARHHASPEALAEGWKG